MTATSAPQPVFLTAEWRNLVMLNYEVDPELLNPYVPRGTELDTWNNTHYISIVGFQFLNTRVRGIPIPFHRNFDEVNLRFYVRHKAHDGWRRGVVFIREVVPRAAIAFVARTVYNEPYTACPMRSNVSIGPDGGTAQYGWMPRGMRFKVSAAVSGAPTQPAPGSNESFIAEHYWGYTAQPGHGTMEYQVDHPPWNIWPATDSKLDGPTAKFYGEPFHEYLNTPPATAFIADGSPISVHTGTRIKD